MSPTTETPAKKYVDFLIPPSIVSKIDVSRLVNEFERVDNEMTAAIVRAKVGTKEETHLGLSEQLKDFLNLNQLRPSSSKERTDLIKQLRLLKDTVPTIHMTFAVEADPQSLQQLAAWLRGSVHPQAVIAVGLQPALIAGVYLRTSNQVRDLSLRSMLKDGRGLLLKDLGALRGSH